MSNSASPVHATAAREKKFLGGDLWAMLGGCDQNDCRSELSHTGPTSRARLGATPQLAIAAYGRLQLGQ